MSIVVLHSTNPALLAAEKPHLTVEAEYGATVVEGSVYTAAHHQPAGSKYAGDHVVAGGRPSPCVDKGIPLFFQEIPWFVGISHVDLDTIGGVLRALPAAADIFAPSARQLLEPRSLPRRERRAQDGHGRGVQGRHRAHLRLGWRTPSQIPRLPLNVAHRRHRARARLPPRAARAARRRRQAARGGPRVPGRAAEAQRGLVQLHDQRRRQHHRPRRTWAAGLRQPPLRRARWEPGRGGRRAQQARRHHHRLARVAHPRRLVPGRGPEALGGARWRSRGHRRLSSRPGDGRVRRGHSRPPARGGDHPAREAT